MSDLMIARLARAKHNHLPSWLSVQADADELRMGARRQRPMEMALRKSKAEALARRQVEYFFNADQYADQEDARDNENESQERDVDDLSQQMSSQNLFE